jgi:hypothetical protein
MINENLVPSTNTTNMSFKSILCCCWYPAASKQRDPTQGDGSKPSAAIEFYNEERKLNRCTCCTLPQRRAIRRYKYTFLLVLSMLLFFGTLLTMWWQYSVRAALLRTLVVMIAFYGTIATIMGLFTALQYVPVLIWGEPRPHFLWLESHQFK